MDNRKERVESKKEDFGLAGSKDLNKGVKKNKPQRREKDAMRKITREFMKGWRGTDFDEDEA